jgi:cytochrome b subunit of formate dehydrogenase
VTREERFEHPWAVRFGHWAMAIAMAVLVPSGLEVLAAFPSFGDKIPQRDLFEPPAIVRLGGWLGGAMQWRLRSPGPDRRCESAAPIVCVSLRP